MSIEDLSPRSDIDVAQHATDRAMLTATLETIRGHVAAGRLPERAWNDFRTAVLAYFDALGPGDTSPASRWPTEDQQGRATVYRTALAAAAIGVGGVLSATTTTPASDVPPAAKRVITLGTFTVTL